LVLGGFHKTKQVSIGEDFKLILTININV
jgi:hypothetical protein